MVPQNARKGLLFALCAVLIFAAQDGISKHLAQEYPPVFIVMIRYWAFAAFVLVWAARAPGGLAGAARSSNVPLQLFRGALLAGQIVVAITAFAVVGLVPTLSLFAAAPLVVAALSVPVLGEAVGWRRWAAIGVGFLGVLIIIRPGPGLFQSEIWISLVAMLGIAIYGVLTRLVSRRDSSATSFFYTGIGGVLVITLVGPFYWTWLAPVDWVWMAILCVTGASGHYFLIRALEATEAVVVQPVQYLQTVLGAFTGVLIFGEILEWEVVGGAALVIAAGLFAAWREAQRTRRSA
jgi:drug/metabolite transporter (DMT)-like permease